VKSVEPPFDVRGVALDCGHIGCGERWGWFREIDGRPRNVVGLIARRWREDGAWGRDIEVLALLPTDLTCQRCGWVLHFTEDDLALRGFKHIVVSAAPPDSISSQVQQ
jgi:hypothetical protein